MPHANATLTEAGRFRRCGRRPAVGVAGQRLGRPVGVSTGPWSLLAARAVPGLARGVDWVDAVVAVLLGGACVGCGRPGRPWCSHCAQELDGAVNPVWLTHAPPTVACLPYADEVPEAIVAYKDRGARQLASQLSNVLAAGLLALGEHLEDDAVLVPVPSSPAALRRRGFDHMGVLAARAGERVGRPSRRILRGGQRADQSGLGFADRRRNISHRVRVVTPGRGPVVLVDDVRTSGATLSECDRALRSAGYTPLAHVVIAGAMSGPDVRSVAGRS